MQGAPDLVVAILSPSNAQDDLTHKRAMYEVFGVKEYWIVNPEDRSVTVLVNTPDGFQQTSSAHGSGTVQSTVLAGLEAALPELFEQ